MDRYKETFETWNKVASLYEERFMQLDLYNETYDYICSSVAKENADLLEIGCGPGNITKYLLAKRPDYQIKGIDVAPNMIELAKKNNPKASFKVMDSRQIQELTEKFDAVICGFCLPYLSVEDSEKLISDCYALLNPNGFIYLSFVEGDPLKSGYQTGSSGYRSYFYYHDPEKLKQVLTENKFESKKTFNVKYKKSEHDEDIHTIMTARKT